MGDLQPPSSSKKAPSTVIRTMKDDISLVSGQPARPAPAATSNRAVTDVQAPGARAPLSFIAPETQPASQMPGMPEALPFQPKRKTNNIVRVGIIFIVMIVLGAGVGGAAWYFWPYVTQTFITKEEAPVEEVALSEVIPASASLVVRYNLSSQSYKQNIVSLWQNETTTDTPIRSLVAGNPSSLTKYSSMTDVAYVLLPNDPRVYVVIKKTEESDQLLSQPSGIQASTIKNWYVLHPINTAPYTTALQAGTFTNQPVSLTKDQMMTWIADPTFVQNMYGNKRASSVLTERVTAKIELSGTPIQSNSNATYTTPASGSGNVNRTSMLQITPGDADYVVSGNNFAQDVIQNTKIRSAFDGEALTAPAVTQLFASLDTPYVYFERVGADGAADEGVIIQLPEGSLLKTADATLEQSLLSLIPAIVGRQSASTLAFAPAEYNGIPLRYVNLQSSTKALDYAVTSKYILISTSKEGMLSLLDLAASTATPSSLRSFANAFLTSSTSTTSSADTFIFFKTAYAIFNELYPGKDAQVPLMVGYNRTQSGEPALSIEIVPTSSSPNSTR